AGVSPSPARGRGGSHGARHPGSGDRWSVRAVGGLGRREWEGGAVTTSGQRFRRRAFRRGYKVDEVDAFLDRVEATLAGGPVDTPVTAQEVRDVEFGVRFGGYDEWQVDLHLDRLERQLAEMAAHGAMAGPPDSHGMG